MDEALCKQFHLGLLHLRAQLLPSCCAPAAADAQPLVACLEAAGTRAGSSTAGTLAKCYCRREWLSMQQ